MKAETLYQGRIYPKDMELTPSYCVRICSNDIDNQLQGNELAFTVFDFCINPSNEDNVNSKYYEGFMQNTFCIIAPQEYRIAGNFRGSKFSRNW